MHKSNVGGIISVVLAACMLFPLTLNSQEEMKWRNTATFCRIWGFLKYYHPAVAKGKTDWDREFLNRVEYAGSFKSKSESSNYYLDWINSLGKVKPCKKCREPAPDDVLLNFDAAFPADTSLFTDALCAQLQHLRANRNQGGNTYVKQYTFIGNTRYLGEKPYRDSVYPSKPMQLLSLARYWNAIHYFFPYKYKTDIPWTQVLDTMVPKFLAAKDTVSYHLAMLELTARIDDSHSRFVTRYTNRYFGMKWAPFDFRLIGDKAVVTESYNHSLCAADDIRIGDVFLSVNGVRINDILRERSRYIGASNEPTRRRLAYYAIFNGDTDSVKVSYERNGKLSDKYIHRYYFRDFRYRPEQKQATQKTHKTLDNNIGYVDLAVLKLGQVKRVMRDLQQTKAIVFDVRNYPNGTMYRIAAHLNSEKKAFVKFTAPDLGYPGVFRYTNTYYCGRRNPDHYKGLVVLLCDESTISHAEFTLMALRTAPRVIIIGSQTAGADGNVSYITLPGDYKATFTGIGVYYPDGRETQRIGIVPDITITPTIEGIRAKKDEVLEKAIEVINERTGK